MKSKRLMLNQFAVKSFVTAVPGKEGLTVKGGSNTFVDPNCTLAIECGDTIVPERCYSYDCL